MFRYRCAKGHRFLVPGGGDGYWTEGEIHLSPEACPRCRVEIHQSGAPGNSAAIREYPAPDRRE